MKRLLLISSLLILAAGAVSAENAGDRSLVQILATCQEYDTHIPWQKKAPATRAGYGVLIGPSQLLTTEDLTRNQALLQLRKPRSGEEYEATVELADYQCNMAVLRISSASFASALIPLALATNLPLNSDVEIVQFDETGEIQRGSARVVRVAVSQLPRAPNACLTIALQAEMNVNGAGAAVIYGGKLAGLIMQYDRNTRTATMLPFPVIRRFREDFTSPPYKGIASAGFLWNPLIDPAARGYYGAPPDGQGILVLSTLPGSGAADVLKSGDVVLTWGGRPVDNLGYYDDPDFGRLLLPYLVSGRQSPGESVPVEMIRDRQRQTVNVRVTRRLDAESLIPENVLGEPAEYAVDAGFVIRELTADYLRAYGQRWEVQVNPRIAHLYLSRGQQPAKPGDRIVILSRVLPDAINVGYHMFHDEIVTKVNGEPVRNMADVFRILDRDRKLMRLSLQGIDLDIVVDSDRLDQANRRIARTYSIPKLRFSRTAR